MRTKTTTKKRRPGQDLRRLKATLVLAAVLASGLGTELLARQDAAAAAAVVPPAQVVPAPAGAVEVRPAPDQFNPTALVQQFVPVTRTRSSR